MNRKADQIPSIEGLGSCKKKDRVCTYGSVSIRVITPSCGEIVDNCVDEALAVLARKQM